MASKISWSDEQLAAIQSINTNELLNAGAGSGKTAVLSEHVIYLLQHGYELNKLLIMTFTNAAASEMKERIKKKIEAIPELNEKYGNEIDACHIETFDAFSLFIVKKYHYILGIDKNLNIIDGNMLEVYKSKVIDEVLNDYYIRKPANFCQLVKDYCPKNDDIIVTMLKTLMNLADLSIDKNKFYDEFVPSHYNEEFVDAMIQERYQNMRKGLDLIYEAAQNLENEKDGENIMKFVLELKKSQNYDELFYKSSVGTLPRKTGKGEFTDGAYRDAIKKYYDNNYRLKTANFGDSKAIKENFLDNKKYAEVFVELAKVVEKKIDAFKKLHNVYSFSDIAKMAISLLDNEDILKEVKASFRYLLIDEYQDTSDIQEALILKIQDNNVFMVGDVKQSIYRFRNANCLIFQNKYNQYKHEHIGGHAIDMTRNFRSRKELVDDFNLIFSQLMNKDVNLIDYNDGHITKFGMTKYEEVKNKSQSYGINVIRYSTDDKKKYHELEAKMIAEDIIEKINSGYQIFGKNGELRPCTFSDFAIIMDRGTQFDKYKRIFNDYKIPLYIYNDDKVTKKTIFLLVPNLIKVFNGVKNKNYGPGFAHAYVSICRSFLIQRNDEDIYNTVKNKDYENDEIIQIFNNLVENSKNKPLYDILNVIFDKFDIYKKIQSIGDYNVIANDIQIILGIMQSMDSLNYCLDDCIEYFQNTTDYDVDIKASPIKESDNSVILLNIHKSKGLEFSVCYFPGLSDDFNRRDVESQKTVSAHYGLAMPARGDIINLARHLHSKEQILQDFEEKLRLFYVGITRAKETAIILDKVDDKEQGNIDIRDAKNFHSFLANVRFRTNGVTNYSGLPGVQLKEMPGIKSGLTFTLKEPINIESKEIIKTRASKTASDDVDEEALEFGNRMHLYLELAKGRDDDLTYIDEPWIKEKIKKVLNCKIFDGVKNENILHEYGFYDENNELLGYIDCLLIKDNEIDIIDFKLKNIDDEAYVRQLQTYYDYIKTKTDKPVKTYLLSIMDGIEKEIKVNG